MQLSCVFEKKKTYAPSSQKKEMQLALLAEQVRVHVTMYL
jgi:hypothetical protein